MRVGSMTGVLVALMVTGWSSVAARQSADRSCLSPGQTGRGETAVAALVDTYCAGCHNGVMRSPSGAVLDRFDAANIGANPEPWAKAYRQLQAGTMPPAGAPRPERRAADAALAAIEDAMSRGVAVKPDAGQAIAVRLARLLWDDEPDAELVRDAGRGALADPATLERHVRRMLGDTRARAFVVRFFFPWLGLDRLAAAEPDEKAFPGFSPALRNAMSTETELFLLSQLREDRDPVELWSANYSFLNEALARHYGIEGVAGPEFRRVALPGPERAGLLGHGSVHVITSRHQHGADAAFTSPATRAIWVRLRFLGAPAPRPFPGAQPVRPDLPITPQTRTLPAEPCLACHRNFFPLGYALENFDPIGRWRTHDQAGPVDASGALVDGTPIGGVVALRQALLSRPDAFRTTIAEKLIVFGPGRPVTSAVTPASLIRARRVLRAAQHPRWSSLVAAIVRAAPLSEP